MIFEDFKKICREISKEGNFRVDLHIIMTIFSGILFRMRNVSDRSSREVGILYSVTLSENRALYEVLRKNILELDRSQVIIHYGTEKMCNLHAAYLRQDTDTHTLIILILTASHLPDSV